MKRTRLSEEQIIGVLHEAGGAVSIREVCRKHSITEQTFFRTCRPGKKGTLIGIPRNVSRLV